MTTSEQSMQMRRASHISWAKTVDRPARTEAARTASHYTRFETQAREANPNATDAQIADIAKSLRSAHYTDLALKSAKARRRRGEALKAAKRARVAEELGNYADADVPDIA